MASFGVGSRAHLATLHKDLQVVLLAAIEEMDFTITEGHRPKERQDALYAIGRTKPGKIRTNVSWPNSKHNGLPSMAVDVAPWPVDYNQREEFTLLAGLIRGIAVEKLRNGEISHIVRWGGDWDGDYDLDDNDFDDLPHFELRKL